MVVPTTLRWWWWRFRPVGGSAWRNAGDDSQRRGMMTRLILKLEDQVLKECAVGLRATIGRLSDNTVVIDNAAVSGHHACVFSDGDQLVVEDLQSSNGTFVNGTRVSRHTLLHGDVVQVGKHKIVLGPPARLVQTERGGRDYTESARVRGDAAGRPHAHQQPTRERTLRTEGR